MPQSAHATGSVTARAPCGEGEERNFRRTCRVGLSALETAMTPETFICVMILERDDTHGDFATKSGNSVIAEA